jgi:hypothetical protein
VRPEKPWDMAHSYYDELPPYREPLQPIITTWREAAVILFQSGLILLGMILFFVALLSAEKPLV